MIFDVDNQISQIVIRFKTTVENISEMVANEYNQIAEKSNIPDRLLAGKSIIHTNQSTNEKIWKLIEEDKKQFQFFFYSKTRHAKQRFPPSSKIIDTEAYP